MQHPSDRRPTVLAAVRRCYRVLAISSACLVLALTAVAVWRPTEALQRPTVLITATAVHIPVRLEAPVIEAAMPDIVPLPKPARLLAAISTDGRPIEAAELTCLAEAVYYEARGEPAEGQRAVAEVVARRAHTRDFPKTICGVVYQDAEIRDGCQFSFACDGIAHGRRDPLAWKRSVSVAEAVIAAAGRADLTQGATYFHAVGAGGGGFGHLIRTVQIGNHVFYRDNTQVAAAS